MFRTENKSGSLVVLFIKELRVVSSVCGFWFLTVFCAVHFSLLNKK